MRVIPFLSCKKPSKPSSFQTMRLSKVLIALAVSLSLSCLSVLVLIPYPGKVGEACAMDEDELSKKPFLVEGKGKGKGKRKGVAKKTSTLTSKSYYKELSKGGKLSEEPSKGSSKPPEKSLSEAPLSSEETLSEETSSEKTSSEASLSEGVLERGELSGEKGIHQTSDKCSQRECANDENDKMGEMGEVTPLMTSESIPAPAIADTNETGSKQMDKDSPLNVRQKQNTSVESLPITTLDMTNRMRSRSVSPINTRNNSKEEISGQNNEDSLNHVSLCSCFGGIFKKKGKTVTSDRDPEDVPEHRHSLDDTHYSELLTLPEGWSYVRTNYLGSEGIGKTRISELRRKKNFTIPFGEFYKENGRGQVLPKEWAVYVKGERPIIIGNQYRISRDKNGVLSISKTAKCLGNVLFIDTNPRTLDSNTLIVMHVRVNLNPDPDPDLDPEPEPEPDLDLDLDANPNLISDPDPALVIDQGSDLNEINLHMALLSKKGKDDEGLNPNHTFVLKKASVYKKEDGSFIYEANFSDKKETKKFLEMSNLKYPGFCWFGKGNKKLEILAFQVYRLDKTEEENTELTPDTTHEYEHDLSL